MVFTVCGDVGVLFSGSRVYFPKRKCALLEMKNSDKIPEKNRKKKQRWCSLLMTISGDGFSSVHF